jgi:hypothetical protein
MVARKVINNVRSGRVLTKWDAYKFESGVRSMTRQIMNAGLSALVVGADGRGYPPAEWPDARTFWIASQENLLVSDNQTCTYLEGSLELREWLAFQAWRRHVDGSPRCDIPRTP